MAIEHWLGLSLVLNAGLAGATKALYHCWITTHNNWVETLEVAEEFQAKYNEINKEGE